MTGPMPGAVVGYRVYCSLLAFAFFGTAGVMTFAFAVGSKHEPDDILVLVIILACTLPLAGLFGFGIFVPPRNWGWIFGLILIVLGGLMLCPAPFAIPLGIFWLRPDCQEWFGRLGAPASDVGQVFN